MIRYIRAMHRVQTAIAILMDRDPNYSATEPKQLRVGVDMSRSDQAGLVRLLVAKGLFTYDEYVEAITKEAENEGDSFEKMVQAILDNRNIRTY